MTMAELITNPDNSNDNTIQPVDYQITSLTLKAKDNAQKVIWVGLERSVKVHNNRISKVGDSSVTTSARSSQTISSGQNGYIEWVVDTTNNNTYGCGLSADFVTTIGAIDYCFHQIGASFNIKENNSSFSASGVSHGDTIRIAVEYGVIKYYKNGTVLRTSTVTPTFPLFVVFVPTNDDSYVEPVIVTSSGNHQTTQLKVQNSAGKDKLVVDGLGRVGIGTTAPTSPLSVDWDFGASAASVQTPLAVIGSTDSANASVALDARSYGGHAILAQSTSKSGLYARSENYSALIGESALSVCGDFTPTDTANPGPILLCWDAVGVTATATMLAVQLFDATYATKVLANGNLIQNNQTNLNGRLNLQTTAIAGTTIIAATDERIFFPVSTASARSITLPAISAVGDGRLYIFKDSTGSGAANNITINRAGSDTIDASATLVINTNYGTARLISHLATSKWLII